MTQQATAPAPAATDGRHDFDFIFGRWRIENRKLQDPLADGPTPWLEFDSTLVVQPILGGLGNCEQYSAPDFPGRPGYHGFGLRLFAPHTGVWRIWWASTAVPGALDEPVVGRFEDGIGRFECDDVIQGRVLRVRYEFSEITGDSFRWQQSFSFDGGRTFEPNWLMRMTRTA